VTAEEKTENTELKAAAEAYFEAGLNVVTVKEKQPLQPWQKWTSQRQTKEEFKNLNFSDADGIGVICGTQTPTGLYLAVMDFDVKKLPDEVIEKGRKVLKELPITQMEQTPSKGQHWIYYVHNKPRSLSAFHNDVALELIGQGKLCIMAPSQGYKRLNDNSPTVIQDLEDLLYNALHTVGIKPEGQSETWFGREEKTGEPYRGKDPNCIRELGKGTKEGLRNDYGIRLASYYGNCKGYKPEICLKILRTWNKLNEPSLSHKELETLLKSALQGHYVYGCNDSILKEICERERYRESCSLAKKETKEVTEQEKAKAESLLKDPKLLEYTLTIGNKWLIGEDDLLRQNIIFIVSGQTRYPISEIITGHSGSGKNQSIRAVKPLIPENWIFEFTTSTPEAIKYIPEDFCGTIIIYELAGIRSETGTLGLRSIGEGEGIKTIYPMRDETTGKMTLGETQTKAKNFISTDSGLDIAADLYRRIFKNSMNDSLALTKRVCAKKMRDNSIPESLRQKIFPEQNKIQYSESDFKNAFELLELNLEVVVFPPSNLLSLIDLAQKKEQEVALRTQIERILHVIKILALIHQKQRIKITGEDNSYIVADVQDVETALSILEKSIVETVTRIEKRQKQALEIFEKTPRQLNKNQLAEKLRCESRTAARILKTLSKNGYLTEIQTTRPYSYELPDEEKHLSPFALSEMVSEYKVIYPKELKTFLNHFLPTYQVGIANNFSVEIPEKIEEKYCIAKWQVGKMPSKADIGAICENNHKTFAFSGRANEKRGS
jgi:DNA-binding MarR family transcriptional regulator